MSDAVEIIQQQNEENDRREARRVRAIDYAEMVLTRISGSTFTEATLLDTAKPMTGATATQAPGVPEVSC